MTLQDIIKNGLQLGLEEVEVYVSTSESNSLKLNDGEYFLMGDNWGETLDSILKGPIKKDEITGKVDLIVDVTNTDKFFAIKYFFKKIFAIN